MTTDAADPNPADGERPQSRLQMLSDVFIFQLKLMADGLRDLIMSPLSLVAAVLGLIAGGDRPDRYFRRVLGLGRRTERWINLWGQHRGVGTSDELVDPFRSRVLDRAQSTPWLNKAGGSVNRQLDGVNERLAELARRARENAVRPPGSPPGPESGAGTGPSGERPVDRDA